MNIFLFTLSLLAPLMLQAAEEPLAEGQPNSHKRKRAANIYTLGLRRDLGSPGSKEFLKQQGALLCTEIPCNYMSISLVNPALEVMPSFLLKTNNILYVSFLSRAAIRHGQNPGTLLNVNTMGLMHIADFPWIAVGRTFSNPLGGDAVLFKTISTRSLSPDILEALKRRIDVLDFSNTSIGFVNNAVIEGFAPNTLKIHLGNVSASQRRINKKTSFVHVAYGNEEESTVDLNDYERDQSALSLFPTEENFATYLAQSQITFGN